MERKTDYEWVAGDAITGTEIHERSGHRLKACLCSPCTREEALDNRTRGSSHPDYHEPDPCSGRNGATRMLTPAELKPYLSHEDAEIRDVAVAYFEQCYYQDSNLVPIILESCRQYGYEENMRGLAACTHFPLTEEAFLTVFERLTATADRTAAHHFNSIIAHAPVDILYRHENRLLESPRVEREIIKRVELRRKLAGWEPERLWAELRDYAEAARSKRYVGDIDHRYVDSLVEALGPHDVPGTVALCDMLQAADQDEGWLEIFIVDLVGIRRANESVPLLVEKYRIDTDYLLERCSRALARIGDPEAVRLVGQAFRNGNWHYRNYASALLPRIKSPLSEDTLIELLESEEDLDIRTSLHIGLLELFSRRGVEIVHRDILDRRYNPGYAELDEDILPVAAVLGIEFLESEDWRRLRAERRRQRAKAEREADEIAQRYARLQRKGIHPLSELSIKPGEPFGPRTPERHHDSKVGRNDPCPCGSGKKYKKCCMGRD